ncbi:MAG: response regulator [Prolixibacteraceae bacterium]
MKEDGFLAGKKIIIAEDDENSFLLLDFMLSELKAQIIHTQTGEDTIQALMNNPDTCLILLDIRMPGKSGIEAARFIRQFNTDVPIIAQTAVMFKDEEKEKALEAGCNDYILKPINRDLLLGKIKHLLKITTFN